MFRLLLLGLLRYQLLLLLSPKLLFLRASRGLLVLHLILTLLLLELVQLDVLLGQQLLSIEWLLGDME